MSHFASVKDRKSCFYFLTRNQISLLLLGIPGDSDGKCGRPGFNPWVGKIPWRSVWPSTLVFLPGKFHGQRSLTSYRPWGHKELDTTEWITHTHTHTHTPLLLSYWCGSVMNILTIPWRRKWQSTSVFLPGKSQVQRGLAGYSSWGWKRVGHDLQQ